MQNKPTKMESGLIELTKESPLGSQRSIMIKKSPIINSKKHPWPDLPILQLAGFFLSNKNLG